MSEQRVGQILKQWRGTQRYQPTVRSDEDALTETIIAMPASMGAMEDHGVAAGSELAGRQGPRAADLATRRAESATETAAARKVVAELSESN